MGTNQQFSLRWNNYLHHITEAFDTLREDENLVDVTLCCEGRKIKAHKMLLSACSSYFREIFKENPCHHPIIVFHNVKYEDLWALVSFMYKGEVNVEQEGLSSFLNTAELLEVQGLTGGPSRTDETDDENSQDIKTNRKQNSPKSFARPESPVLKRRKLPTEDNLKKDHKTPLALVKTEPDFYGGDSHDESEDQKPQSLSLSQKLDKNYDNNYSDENMDGSSEIGSAGGSNNDMTNMQDSLQVFAHGLWRRLHPSLKRFGCDECGKVFKHPRSLDHHKKMHEGRTTCPYCRRVFGRMYALRLHISSSHPGVTDIPSVHSTKSH
ncbi:unnamed protein product [Nezara viridula]|uniref:Uncharacterized protein n=1 Tax=Nezara viridula TaxID=85310 RepID=A0A9P0E3M7_NEZVI|nr:unnamed protein product [Nezara viridula]